MDSKFCVLDVETANFDYSSICQIGIAQYQGAELIGTWKTYVNPRTDFFTNTFIHGITYEMVKDAPTFPSAYDEIKELLANKIVIHHMPFDKAALKAVCNLYDLEVFDYSYWLDSAKMVRRTYSDLAQIGYGLANVANRLGIEFLHHDALEDASATGKIAYECCKEKGFTLVEWKEFIDKSKGRITPRTKENIAQEGNPDGHLYGEKVVFTGSLSMLRKEAAALAAGAGCSVLDGVTKETTMLVVGVQNTAVLKDQKNSSKQLKANKLISEGYDIRILTESDFISLVNIE